MGKVAARMLSRSFFRTAMALRPAVAAMRTIRCRPFSSTADLDLSQYDSAQLTMMEEMCIVTDFHDTVVGEDTKKIMRSLSQQLATHTHKMRQAGRAIGFHRGSARLKMNRCTAGGIK